MPLVAPATREHTIRIVAVDTTTGILTTERPHGMMQDATGARSCVRLVGDDLPRGGKSVKKGLENSRIRIFCLILNGT
jgi:hypothetical protein